MYTEYISDKGNTRNAEEEEMTLVKKLYNHPLMLPVTVTVLIALAPEGSHDLAQPVGSRSQ